MGPLIDAFFLSLQALLCNDDRPMMLGYEGNFLNLTLVAIIDLWARILHDRWGGRPYDVDDKEVTSSESSMASSRPQMMMHWLLRQQWGVFFSPRCCHI